MHFNSASNAGYNRILYVFSPDLGRSVHGFVPTGVIEGLAVYRETELFTDGGRGNHAPLHAAILRESFPLTGPGTLQPTSPRHPTQYHYQDTT